MCFVCEQKFDQEVSGHEPVVGKVISRGKALVAAKHFASQDIDKKRGEVQDAWQDLVDHTQHRKGQLDKALLKQKVRH